LSVMADPPSFRIIGFESFIVIVTNYAYLSSANLTLQLKCRAVYVTERSQQKKESHFIKF